MLKRRLIPVLFLQQGHMVRSEQFRHYNVIGNPIVHVERMVQWDVDELIIIDISEGEAVSFDIFRDDYRHKGSRDILEFVHKVASECRIPLAFGGRIRSLEDVRLRITNGADKVTINSAMAENPSLISETTHAFGSQAVIVSVDYRMVDGEPVVFTHHGKESAGIHPGDWARRAQDLGAGEILLNAIDRDGTAVGYDIEVINRVVDAVDMPVIACGGAGHQSHFARCFEATGASGVAAGNIFHFTENAYPRAKKFLRTKRTDTR